VCSLASVNARDSSRSLFVTDLTPRRYRCYNPLVWRFLWGPTFVRYIGKGEATIASDCTSSSRPQSRVTHCPSVLCRRISHDFATTCCKVPDCSSDYSSSRCLTSCSVSCSSSTVSRIRLVFGFGCEFDIGSYLSPARRISCTVSVATNALLARLETVGCTARLESDTS
jgi:hypothetical protein